MSESNRLLVAGGVLIGALALGALELRFGNRESAAKETDGRFDSALSSAARPVTREAPLDDSPNAGIARVLQAVHDSLQRGDLASARVLLDAVLAVRKDEPQALLLQQELAAREAPMAASYGSQAPSKIQARTHARMHASARTAHVHAMASLQASAATRDDTQATAAPAAIQPQDTTAAESTPGEHAASTAHVHPDVAAQVAMTSVTQATQAADEPAGRPVPPPAAASAAQAVALPTLSSGAAPKTRAEVRDELRRARTNGSMARFGNPDPYGPGGSPSYNAQPSMRAW